MEAVLAGCFLEELPERLIGDKACDSDSLDQQMKEYGIAMISPNRSNRKRKTQDGRPLRRYRRRWKIERLFAWMQNYRRLIGFIVAANCARNRGKYRHSEFKQQN